MFGIRLQDQYLQKQEFQKQFCNNKSIFAECRNKQTKYKNFSCPNKHVNLTYINMPKSG
jgi:hypothetical protein